MVVAVTKLPVKPDSMNKAKAMLKELAPGLLENVAGLRRVHYTATEDAIRAFGVWDSAQAYNDFADAAMGKALAPFKDLMTGPPEKTIYEEFFSVEK